MILDNMTTIEEEHTITQLPVENTRTVVAVENIVIREISLSAEAEKVADLVEEAYVYGGHIDEDNKDYVPILRNTDHRGKHCKVFVASIENTNTDADGTIIGTLSMVQGSAKNIYSGKHPYIDLAENDEVELRMLAVSPRYQGNDIGGALIKYVLYFIREANKTMVDFPGYHHIESVVCYSGESMKAAHALYGRNGFEHIPEKDMLYEDDKLYYAFKRALENP